MKKIGSFIFNYLEELFLLIGLFFIAFSGYMLDGVVGVFLTGVAFIVTSNLIINLKRTRANRRR